MLKNTFIVLLDGKSKEVREWYIDHIYCMHKFRALFDQQQETTDPHEEQRIGVKLRHPQKEAMQHNEYGKSLEIPKNEIDDFNLAIFQRVKQKKTPKTIIQELIKENGQK